MSSSVRSIEYAKHFVFNEDTYDKDSFHAQANKRIEKTNKCKIWVEICVPFS